MSGTMPAGTPTAGTPTVVPVQNFTPAVDVDLLRRAMKGIGTDEKTIIRIIPKRSNAQRQRIKECFKEKLNRDLIKDFKSELSGCFKDTIMALMTPSIEYDAKELKKSTKGLGTDNDALIELLCSRTPQEIKNITEIYENVNGSTLEKDIKGDLSGHYKNLMIALATGNRDDSCDVDEEKARRDADKLYKAGEGRMGTNEDAFISVLSTQNYAQLCCLKSAYLDLRKKSLEEAISSEMSGNLKKALLAILSVATCRRTYFVERLHKAMVGLGTDDKSLIRILVYSSEKDLGDIKHSYAQTYGINLATRVADDTSGDYKRTLMGILDGT